MGSTVIRTVAHSAVNKIILANAHYFANLNYSERNYIHVVFLEGTTFFNSYLLLLTMKLFQNGLYTKLNLSIFGFIVSDMAPQDR